MIYDPKLHGKKKELYVAKTPQECQLWDGYVAAKHLIVFDPYTQLHSVFRRSQDRTVSKVISRESRHNFRHYKRKLVVMLEPSETIGIKLKGTRKITRINFDDLYCYLLRCEALAEGRRKQVERAARRKARRAK